MIVCNHGIPVTTEIEFVRNGRTNHIVCKVVMCASCGEDGAAKRHLAILERAAEECVDIVPRIRLSR